MKQYFPCTACWQREVSSSSKTKVFCELFDPILQTLWGRHRAPHVAGTGQSPASGYLLSDGPWKNSEQTHGVFQQESEQTTSSHLKNAGGRVKRKGQRDGSSNPHPPVQESCHSGRLLGSWCDPSSDSGRRSCQDTRAGAAARGAPEVGHIHPVLIFPNVTPERQDLM